MPSFELSIHSQFLKGIFTKLSHDKPSNKISCKQSFYLHVVYTMLIHFPRMFLLIQSNSLPVQSKEDHFWIETLYHQSTLWLPFLIFVFKRIPQLYKHMYLQNIPRMVMCIDPCSLPFYQVVFSFCCLIAFCFILSPRMSLP